LQQSKSLAFSLMEITPARTLCNLSATAAKGSGVRIHSMVVDHRYSKPPARRLKNAG